MQKPIIVYGNRSLGKMLWMDAQGSNDFMIKAFIVDEAYLNEDRLFCGCPQVSYNDMINKYQPNE